MVGTNAFVEIKTCLMCGKVEKAKKEKQAQEKADTIHAAAETIRVSGKHVDSLTLDELKMLLRDHGILPQGDKATLLAEYKKHAPAQTVGSQ